MSLTVLQRGRTNPADLQSTTEATACELVDAGAVRAIQVVRDDDAWAVVLQIALQDRGVRSQRKSVWTRRSLDTLAAGIGQWGAARFEVMLWSAL